MMLAINVPIAAPRPPTHGPKSAAKSAGINTAGLSWIIAPVGMYAVAKLPAQ